MEEFEGEEIGVRALGAVWWELWTHFDRGLVDDIIMRVDMLYVV